MARVIGKSKQVEKRCTCQGCGSIVAYLPNEVKRRDGVDYGGGPDGDESIPCPNCGARIILRAW